MEDIYPSGPHRARLSDGIELAPRFESVEHTHGGSVTDIRAETVHRFDEHNIRYPQDGQLPVISAANDVEPVVVTAGVAVPSRVQHRRVDGRPSGRSTPNRSCSSTTSTGSSELPGSKSSNTPVR